MWRMCTYKCGRRKRRKQEFHRTAFAEILSIPEVKWSWGKLWQLGSTAASVPVAPLLPVQRHRVSQCLMGCWNSSGMVLLPPLPFSRTSLPPALSTQCVWLAVWLSLSAGFCGAITSSQNWNPIDIEEVGEFRLSLKYKLAIHTWNSHFLYFSLSMSGKSSALNLGNARYLSV